MSAMEQFKTWVESQMHIMFNVYDGPILNKNFYDNLLTMISDVEKLCIAN